LGSRPRKGLARMRAKRECGRVWEWTLTLPNELPCWELESWWTLEIFRKQLQGIKPIALRSFLYHWKAIETKMSKMGSHDPFGHLKHKLWPKERLEIKLAIWLLTTKSRESTQFPYVKVACDTLLRNSWRGLQLCFRPHPDRRSAHKVIIRKVVGVPTLATVTKSYLDVVLAEKRKVYYMGEGGGFPQVWVMASLVNPRSSMARPSTKSVPTMH
jgi:hypothetical protein